ncbi:MAG: glycosyltransferase family 2 protein [Cyanobium sp. MAG06]|nr:glycosyltransferase family 2 protein [Cyanobium sp. MAG06]
MNSIQSLNYPREKIKIIFIDNNSTDNTREIVDDIVKNDNRVMYIFEKRQGKHHAINTGIDNVNTNYLAIMDADTVLDKDSLIKPIQLLKDDNAMVICSHNIVHKDENILQMAQRAEFTISIFWRKMYSTMDAIQVLPGPYTIFNKKVFDNIGNYKDAHKAEDFEMTLRLHKHHYKIMNPLSAIARTTGPSTIRGLYRQRLR